MALKEYRKWLAFGTGAGIEIGECDLDVTLVRVRPSGAETLGTLHIERFRNRPAAEWGAEYTNFLKHHGAGYLVATVLLPRRDVIVRQLAMAGVAERDLPQAIAFQIDGLHPFSEEEAVHAWARLDDQTNVVVGITRRQVIEQYVTLFSEAGIKVAAFTFSAAAIYGSLRLFSAPPSDGLLAFYQIDGEAEAYGESPARALFSATFDIPSPHYAERARGMAIAELRLPAETPVRDVAEILPKPKRAPEGFDLAANSMPYATAVVAACPRLGLHVNLLPAERRAASSRLMFVPALVLGLLLVAGAIALAIYSHQEDKKYLARLQGEIANLDPQAREPMRMDKAVDQARARTLLLDQFRKRTRDDMDALAELTKILEPPAFLHSLEMTRDSVRMNGEGPQAAGMLRALDKSPLFEGSEFSAPLSRTQTGDIFGVRTRREGLGR